MKKKKISRVGQILWSVAGLLILGYIALGLWRLGWIQLQDQIRSETEKMYLTRLYYIQNPPEQNIHQQITEKAWQMIPYIGYMKQLLSLEPEIEDAETIQWILKCQAEDENAIDQDGNLVGEETAEAQQAQAQPVVPQMDLSLESLRDFDYLLSNFYTVDSGTMIDASQLNVDDLLSRSMKIDLQTGGPKILIFHTHSQEEFVDSVPGDPATSIVGVGAYLTEQLNAKGIPTIHHDGIYDIINGELDRSNAYEYAEAGVRQILAENPTVEVVIDLHRDGVGEDTHLVTEANGKQTAKIMFFNGLSRTRTMGDIDYLYNPYIQDNLSFSFQMQMACEAMYPGFARHIYLRGYRYNLHLMPKSLLIEAGAQTNTVGEMKNAMEVLADTLHRVLVE